MLDLVMWVGVHGPEVVASLVAALSALIVLFALIPGDQPEKALQGVVDFIKKLSRK